MTSGIHPTTTRKLRAFDRRRRLLLIARALCAPVVSLLGSMTLIALLDRVVFLPDWARLALSAAAYAAVLALTWRVSVRPFLRRGRDTRTAELFGAAYPALGDDVLSAVELGASGADARHDSPVFREMLQGSVAERLAGVPVAPLLPWRLIAGWLTAAAALAVTVVALAWVPGLRFGDLMTRALLPPANIARVSNTVIKLIAPANPDAAVPRGDPLPIVVEVRGNGGAAADAMLRVYRRGEPVTGIKMEPDGEDGRFKAALEVGQEPVEFRVESGDGATKRYTVNARPRPEAIGFEKTYTYPAYTRLGPKHVIEDHGDLAALEGSSVRVDVRPDQEISEASLEVEAGDYRTRVAMTQQPMASGVGTIAAWSATLPVNTSGFYQVHLAAAASGFENTFSPRYEIRPLPDLRPTAEIIALEPRERAGPTGAIHLRGAAGDDVGLANVSLMVRVNNRSWAETVLTTKAAPTTPGSLGTRAEVERKWNLAEPGLHAGDQITLKLVATDLKGNTGESEPRRITIVAVDPRDDPHHNLATTQPDKTKPTSETLRVLAREAAALEGSTIKELQSGPKPAPQTAVEAVKIGEKQAEFDKRLAAAREALRTDADGQDMLTPAGREAARDDDDAVAMLRDRGAAEQLRMAAGATDSAAQKSALQAAAADQGKTAANLDKLADYFANAEAGHPGDTRAALRDNEAGLGIKPTLDAQYGQLARLAAMTRMPADQLKVALENELPGNPAMQAQLGRIAHDTLGQAQGELNEAAEQENQMAAGLGNAAAQPRNAADAAGRQPAIADALGRASADIARAAVDAQRLSQPGAAALEAQAGQVQAVAGNQVKVVQQALESQTPGQARGAVQKAAEAIAQQAQGVAKAMAAAEAAAPGNSSPQKSSRTQDGSQKSADGDQQSPSPSPSPSSPSSSSSRTPGDPGKSAESSAGRTQNASSSPLSGDKQASPGDASASAGGQHAASTEKPAQGEPSAATPSGSSGDQQTAASANPLRGAHGEQSPATQPSPSADEQQGSTGEQTRGDAHGEQSTAARPVAAASAWMAAALDQLDRSAQMAGRAQPSRVASKTSGPATTNQSANGASSASSSNTEPAGSTSKANAPDKSSNNVTARATGSSESEESKASGQAAASIRAAAEAQAQAVRDARANADNPAIAAGGPTRNSPGDGRATDTTVPLTTRGPSGNSSGGGDGAWGKFTPEQARDLMEARRENIPSEYREKVEAYFRAIAEKAAAKGQP